jgi:hypothetical protein
MTGEIDKRITNRFLFRNFYYKINKNEKEKIISLKYIFIVKDINNYRGR